MSAPFTISPQARDLTLNLSDSCNCCCFAFRNSKKQIFVNTKGDVVDFDPRKAISQTVALNQCVSNLSAVIGSMAESRRQHKSEVLARVNQEIVDLESEDPKPITLDMIRKILKVIDDTPSPSMPLLSDSRRSNND